MILAFSLATLAALPSRGEGPEIWRDSAGCGPNCAYQMLKIAGRSPDYLALRAQIPFGEKGSRFGDVREAMRSAGMACEMIRVSGPAELAPEVPAIVQVEPEGPESGRFLVVLSIGDREVEYIDGSSLLIERMTSEAFHRMFSGHAIVERAPAMQATHWALLGAGVFFFFYQSARRAGWRVASSLREARSSPRRGRGWGAAGHPGLTAAFALVVVLGARGSRADDGVEDAGRIADSIVRSRAGLAALSITYRVKSAPLVEGRTVFAHLKINHRVDTEETFEFSGTSRRFRVGRAALVEPIGPDVALSTRSVAPLAEYTFDAGRLSILTGSPDSSLAFITDDLRKYKDRYTFAQRYLDAVGWAIPDVLGEGVGEPEDVAASLGAGKYGRTGRRSSVDGRECVVFRSDAGTLVLDAGSGYAIRDWTINHPGTAEPSVIYENRDFLGLKAGLWLPRAVVMRLCGPPSSPAGIRGQGLLSVNYVLTAASSDPIPDGRFRPALGPGTKVWDESRSGRPASGPASFYTIPPRRSGLSDGQPPATGPAVPGPGRSGAPGGEAAGRSPRRRDNSDLVVVGVVVLALGLIRRVRPKVHPASAAMASLLLIVPQGTLLAAGGDPVRSAIERNRAGVDRSLTEMTVFTRDLASGRPDDRRTALSINIHGERRRYRTGHYSDGFPRDLDIRANRSSYQDGEFRVHYPRLGRTDVFRKAAVQEKAVGELYLECTGLWPAGDGSRVRDSSTVPFYLDEVLDLPGTTRSTVPGPDGSPLLLVRSPTQHLLLDPARNFQLVRREYTSAERGIRIVYEAGDFREVDGTWWPGRVEKMTYIPSPDDRSIYRKVAHLTATVDRLVLGVELDESEAPPPPGTLVVDIDSGTHHQVPGGLAFADDVASLARARLAIMGRPPATTSLDRSGIGWRVLGCLILLTAAPFIIWTDRGPNG